MLVDVWVDLFAIDSVPEGTERKKENEMVVGSMASEIAEQNLAWHLRGIRINMNQHNDIECTHHPFTLDNQQQHLRRQSMYKSCTATSCTCG